MSLPRLPGRVVATRQAITGVETSLWRAQSAFRAASAVFAIYVIARYHAGYAHPAGGLIIAAVIGLWTVLAVVVSLGGLGGDGRWVVLDVAVTTALTLSSLAVQSSYQLHGHRPTVTTAWALSAGVGAAIWRGWPAGLLAGVVQAASTIVVRDGYDGRTLTNIVWALLATVITGYVSRLALRAEADLAAATATRAAVAERERLAADIHDGVLQVLALVRRRGLEAGGEAGEIARLAGAQEHALRALVTTAAPAPSGQFDVVAELRLLRSPEVSVATPNEVTPVNRARGEALLGATRAALDNAARHAGDKAWVLLEERGGEFIVTVRDDGPGIAPGRLDEARAAGRIGVAGSIVGRMAAAGGQAEVISAPGQGTEIRLRIPVS